MAIIKVIDEDCEILSKQTLNEPEVYIIVLLMDHYSFLPYLCTRNILCDNVEVCRRKRKREKERRRKASKKKKKNERDRAKMCAKNLSRTFFIFSVAVAECDRVAWLACYFREGSRATGKAKSV